LEAPGGDVVSRQLAIGRRVLAQREHLAEKEFAHEGSPCRGARAAAQTRRRNTRLPAAVKPQAVYFFRKLSRGTNSPGVPEAALTLALAGSALGPAGAAVAIAPSASTCLNCRPNCTEGSAKVLMAAKGTVSRAGLLPKLRVTEKASSVTSRSQNWCSST